MGSCGERAGLPDRKCVGGRWVNSILFTRHLIYRAARDTILGQQNEHNKKTGLTAGRLP